ncbi:beta-1,4-mannosyltransferase [Coprinopsis cinerea okayama7|uniref:Chitobiosyldiphosphodolichol beta-mannosyltransferase n=1 Tax=Coprinopsis cinerea (strain Okayama-7 / 130 / ATCC MYA-4618 / FGSC 9003) TaxID=240176 RepID=A8N236_COPC7|nr:beta-1,4-mannosyltransferase [Coprinopsis cinerea okayama7\|eukprot:XP_001828935.2 beta-1,4-mannosyltransferase [Coprinopsis cinerea okayama7\
MYHAQSFAENGFMTELVGYGGSDVIPALERLPRVQIRHLPDPPWILKKLPFVVAAPFKILHQLTAILLILLVYIEKPPEFLLVQNPPSIPTLAIVQLVARIRGSKVIIDWHNLGYSILALRLGQNHIFVRISEWFERTFGQSAYAHLFVTRAMRDHLVKEWDLRGHKVVLHDRPPRHFHRSSPQETHELFQRLRPLLAFHKPLRGFLPKDDPPYSTPFTEIGVRQTSRSPNRASTQGRVQIVSRPTSPGVNALGDYTEIRAPSLRPDRPALLVSSTSWTPDEDFGILLQALSIYELRAREVNKEASKGTTLPKVLAIVTGKGPLKDRYMKEVSALQESWQWVRCISLWLEAEDYPILLGSADLGVSLHSSSSALDLPMKVVDMFGCGLPVCALGFSCLPELVKHGKNGLIFRSAPELAEQLEDLFTSFPQAKSLAALSLSLASTATRPSTPNVHGSRKYKTSTRDDDWKWSNWEDNWAQTMRPLILNDVNL